jgi:predicted ATPase/class 3 adenylate cyclase
VGARDDLPTGTVTLMFADIEGSTRLLDTLGDRYAGVLRRARALARAEVDEHRGVEVDTAGDGSFYAFRTPQDAVAAAAAVHRALAAERWPQDVAVRLRVGIHTGTPLATEEGYIGLDVHRAARICAVSHGGQVVVSQQARELLGDELPDRLALRALGSHRLKDVPEPMMLHQLVGDGLEDGFAPLRALGSSLPALHHRLVGREREREQLETLLDREGTRLVTITGPGGAGKSRLALEVAVRRAEARHVSLVGLASIADPVLVPAAIARAVGVREAAGRDLVDEIALALTGRNVLLVLDNLEHLPGAADTVRQLLSSSFDVTVLATSRVPLRLAAERVLGLEPLGEVDAAALFHELAAARGVPVPDDSETTVRRICRRLDNLPLAIELVVARLNVLSPTALLEALDTGLALRTEGPVDLPERQRTLRATIAWSYSLISPAQRDLHQLLAVFAGGATIGDLEAVATPGTDVLEGLAALADGNLIRADADAGGGSRISMLDTVRDYAVERLAEDGALDRARDAHMRLFLQLAEAAEAELAGPDQRRWLDLLEAEHDNLRAALQRALDTGLAEDMLRAVSATGRFWRAHGHVAEARRWLRAGLAAGAPVDAGVLARAQWTDARQAMAQGHPLEAVTLLDAALALFRSVGDEESAVFALCELSQAHVQLGDLDAASREAASGLAAARALDDPRALSAALNTTAGVAVEQEDHDTARALYGESLALRRTLDDPLLVVNSANNLGLAAFRQGDREAATRALEECLELARELGDELHSASALCALGELALLDGDPATGARLLLQAHASYVTLEDDRMQAECLHGLGAAAAAAGHDELGARLWGAADAARARLGAVTVPEEDVVQVLVEASMRHNLGAARLAGALEEGRRADVAELLAQLAREGKPTGASERRHEG